MSAFRRPSRRALHLRRYGAGDAAAESGTTPPTGSFGPFPDGAVDAGPLPSAIMLFCIHCQDKPDSLELRKATRPSHLEYLADFETPVGGPLLDADGDPCGSVIFLEADDLAAAEAFAAGDPYRQAGLFETVTVRAFHTVMWPEGAG